MYRAIRTVLMSLALALPLAACGSMNYDFDPTDLIPADLFGSKKKLPGERKPVFPEGVPGATRGVPQDLVKLNQVPGTEDAFAPQQTAVQAEEPKPKPKAQPKPKPAPKTTTAATQSTGSPTPITVRRSDAPAWPDTPQQQQRPQQQQPAAQWPDPPGTRSQPPAAQPPAAQWPDPPGTRSQPGGQSVQWPDPPAPR